LKERKSRNDRPLVPSGFQVAEPNVISDLGEIFPATLG